MTIQNFKDSLAQEIFGVSLSAAKSEGICLSCKEPAIAKCYSDAGRREFQISGICEICFDNMFK